MVPMFILTRTFAISALFVGAAPLAQAAPTFGVPGCLSAATCQPSQPTMFWTFLSAIVPSMFAQAENSAAVVEMKPAIDLAVLVGLNKRDDAILEKRDPLEASIGIIQAREPDVPIIRDEPGIAARQLDVLNERDPEAEDIEDRSCAFVAICRRDKEVARDSDSAILALEASTDPDA